MTHTPASTNATWRVSAADLTEFCVAALTKVGLRPEDARIAADVLVTTDSFGVFTHGVKNLAGYIRRIKAGGIRADAWPVVAAEGPSWAIVDGQSTLGMLSAVLAMNKAIEKATETGVGYCGVRNGCHAGAMGYYALMAAEKAMIGLAMANDAPSMTVPGAYRRVLGNNPLSYAAPAGRHPPIFLDIATSAVAGGKIYQAQALGQEIPEGWLVDEQGQPTTDPHGFPQSKTLLPMAGHKGYGLALLIETLAAALTGAPMAGSVLSWIVADPSLPTGHGGAFLAINVGAIVPIEQFRQHMDQLIDYVHTADRAAGCDRIYVPGEMEWERRALALKQGIELPPEAAASVNALAAQLGLALNTL